MYIIKYINNDILYKIDKIRNKYIKKKLMNLYNFKKVTINNKICNENMNNNLQFIKINDKEYYCATRNVLDTTYLNDTFFNNIDNSKKHLIIRKSIDSSVFRNSLFFGTAIINGLSAIILNKHTGIDFSLLFNTINICNISYYGAASIDHTIDKIVMRDPNYDALNNMEEIYQEIINRFCLLAYSLNMTTPIEIMALYNVMYNNNLLSVKTPSRSIDFDELDIFLIDRLAYNIILGKNAVCRNHSTIFRDICFRMGYDARIIVGTINDNDDLEDHAIVEVKYNNKYIYIDAFNYDIFEWNGIDSMYQGTDNSVSFNNSKYSFFSNFFMKLYGFNKIVYKGDTVSVSEWEKEYKKSLEKLELVENYYKIEKFRYDNNKLFTDFYEIASILDTNSVKSCYKKLKNI